MQSHDQCCKTLLAKYESRSNLCGKTLSFSENKRRTCERKRAVGRTRQRARGARLGGDRQGVQGAARPATCQADPATALGRLQRGGHGAGRHGLQPEPVLRAAQGAAGRPERATDMRFDYAPGLYGMSDFSGKTLALRTATGPVDVEIFVAVLPHSGLTYAEAVPDQKVRHWTMAHRRALEYFGGSTSRWIIDNLKSGVVKADREDPQLNPSFRELAKHYGLAILPAHTNSPKHKAAAESAVKTAQSRILLPLQNETFFSLGEMNAAIRRGLDRLNDAPTAKGPSRRAAFEVSASPSILSRPGAMNTRRTRTTCPTVSRPCATSAARTTARS